MLGDTIRKFPLSEETESAHRKDMVGCTEAQLGNPRAGGSGGGHWYEAIGTKADTDY